jgi:hypothetical protein
MESLLRGVRTSEGAEKVICFKQAVLFEEGMRGDDGFQDDLFVYGGLGDRVSVASSFAADSDAALTPLSKDFASMYAPTGRPWIPPEHLLRALLLQMLYSVRSERRRAENDCRPGQNPTPRTSQPGLELLLGRSRLQPHPHGPPAGVATPKEQPYVPTVPGKGNKNPQPSNRHSHRDAKKPVLQQPLKPVQCMPDGKGALAPGTWTSTPYCGVVCPGELFCCNFNNCS